MAVNGIKFLLSLLFVWTLVSYFNFVHQSEQTMDGAMNYCPPIQTPDIIERQSVKYFNAYWQQLNYSDGEIHLWRAFYDDRPEISGPYVRILAMTTRIRTPIITCNVWYQTLTNEWTLLTSTGDALYGWIEWWGDPIDYMMQALIISCPIQSVSIDIVHPIPLYVTLSINPCSKAENLMKVIHSKTDSFNYAAKHRKRKIAVCSKWLDFYHSDMSVRLIEWIEMVRILGASHIFISKLHIHPNMEKVIQYYEMLGSISVTNFSLPGSQPNNAGKQHNYIYSDIQKQIHNEMISLYDCLYRAIIASYDYLIVMDIDEMLVPMKRDTWHELLDDLESNHSNSDAFTTNRVYFLDSDNSDEEDIAIKGVPKYLHMMTHVYRNNDRNIKSIHNLKRTLTIWYHDARTCAGADSKCINQDVPIERARTNHYRVSPNEVGLKYQTIKTLDSHLWKYLKRLNSSVYETLSNLGWEHLLH